MQTEISHVRRLARLLFWMTATLLIAAPAAIILGLVRGLQNPALVAAQMPALPQSTHITSGELLLVAALGGMILPPLIWGLWQMCRLFTRYASGEILSHACARHILRIGQAALAISIIMIVTPSFQLLVLTHDNAPDAKVISISISGAMIGLMLIGLLLVAIGWVMGEATRIADENAEFV